MILMATMLFCVFVAGAQDKAGKSVPSRYEVRLGWSGYPTADDNNFAALEETLKKLEIEFDEVDKVIVANAKLFGDITGIQKRLQGAFDEGIINEAELKAANDALADYAANLTESQKAMRDVYIN